MREAALVVALGPVVKAPLVIALASRVVMTLADLLWAGTAALLHRGHAPAQAAEAHDPSGQNSPSPS